MNNGPTSTNAGPRSSEQTVENQQDVICSDFQPASIPQPEFSQRPKRKRGAASKVDALSAFRLRCEVRALLVAEGELDLQIAVDELQAGAVKSSIIDVVGQDAVQAIMAAAFAKVRRQP
jgi:hypothetical protein